MAHASAGEVRAAAWHPLVPRSAVRGNFPNVFGVSSDRRWTHVRLSIHPDGGVSRLRVHGEVVADPVLFEALDTVDLAALEHGGRVVDCSNRFYGPADRLIAPGLARSMGEGWETARRRDDGNDWVLVRLAAPGVVRVVELDTTWFLGNAPGWAALRAFDHDNPTDNDATGADVAGAGSAGTPLLERVRLQPDTRHRFVLADAPEATSVRLDVYPDGGMARLRLWGRATESGADLLRTRWAETAPPDRDPQTPTKGEERD